MHGPVSRRMRLSGCCLCDLGAWMCVGTASAGTWQQVGVGIVPGGTWRDRAAFARGRQVRREFRRLHSRVLGDRLYLQERGDRVRARAVRIPARCTPARRRRPCPAFGWRLAVGGSWRLPGPGRGGHQRAESQIRPSAMRASRATRRCAGRPAARTRTWRRVVHGRRQSGSDVHLRCPRGSHAPPRRPRPRVAAGSPWASGIVRAGTWRAAAARIRIRRSAARISRATRRCAGRPVARTRTWRLARARAARIPARCTLATPPRPPRQPCFNLRWRRAHHRKSGSPAPPVSAWQAVGIGDCPGRDVAGSAGPTPDPSKCDSKLRGQHGGVLGQRLHLQEAWRRPRARGARTQARCTPVPANAAAPPPGPPKVQGKRYLVVNYTGDTQNPHDFIVDWKACKVAELNKESENGTEDISVLVCRPGSRLVIKTDFRATGHWIQYDWVMLDGGATMAGSYRDPTTCGPSAGKRGK
jgi:hypothetical protein